MQKHNAVLWLKKAANQGDARSLFILGSLYETGNSVAKDIQKAERYYRSAANKGHKKAAEKLRAKPFLHSGEEKQGDEEQGDEVAETYGNGSQHTGAQTTISRGEPGKESLPITDPSTTRSGRCRFLDESKAAIKMGDGRVVFSAKLKLLEEMAAQEAKKNTTTALDVKSAQGWNTMAEFIETYDFSADPIGLCFLHAFAKCGNDNFAEKMFLVDGLLITPNLTSSPNVQQIVKEDLIFLQAL